MNILNVFGSPRIYFTRLKEKPVWLLPLIIVLACALFSTFIASRYIRFGEIAERMRERGMPEEQIERVKTFYESPKAIIISLISVIFTTAIFLFVLSLLLNLALPLLGSEGVFLKTFSLVVNTSLISALGNIVRALLMLLKKSPFVSTNLSLILPQSLKKTFLFSLFSQLDIFFIWQFALIGFGLSLIYEMKGKRGYYLSFGLYLLWLIFVTLIFRRPTVGR